MLAVRIRDDIGKGIIGLQLAPRGRSRCRRQVAQVDRAGRIADVDEGRAVGAAHQRVLFAGEWIGPAPDAAAVAAADRAVGQERAQIDVVARVDARHAGDARSERHRRHGLSRLLVGQETGAQGCARILGACVRLRLKAGIGRHRSAGRQGKSKDQRNKGNGRQQLHSGWSPGNGIGGLLRQVGPTSAQ